LATLGTQDTGRR